MKVIEVGYYREDGETVYIDVTSNHIPYLTQVNGITEYAKLVVPYVCRFYPDCVSIFRVEITAE